MSDSLRDKLNKNKSSSLEEERKKFGKDSLLTDNKKKSKTTTKKSIPEKTKDKRFAKDFKNVNLNSVPIELVDEYIELKGLHNQIKTLLPKNEQTSCASRESIFIDAFRDEIKVRIWEAKRKLKALER